MNGKKINDNFTSFFYKPFGYTILLCTAFVAYSILHLWLTLHVNAVRLCEALLMLEALHGGLRFSRFIFVMVRSNSAIFFPPSSVAPSHRRTVAFIGDASGGDEIY